MKRLTFLSVLRAFSHETTYLFYEDYGTCAEVKILMTK